MTDEPVDGSKCVAQTLYDSFSFSLSALHIPPISRSADGLNEHYIIHHY